MCVCVCVCVRVCVCVCVSVCVCVCVSVAFLRLGSNLEFGGPENEGGGGCHDTVEKFSCTSFIIASCVWYVHIYMYMYMYMYVWCVCVCVNPPTISLSSFFLSTGNLFST